jgi:ATP-dependent DNA helicase RecQ
VTLVFSPLIALMEDQVSALKKRGIRAEFINSTLDRAERERRYAALADFEYDLIYVTPERMYKPEFRAALEAIRGGIKLLAVDEAHCITKWGHDFRPAYKEVGRFRVELGSPLTIALTATATPAVRQDIRRTLSLDEKEMPLFASGLDRPNLSFEAMPVWTDDEKVDTVESIANASPGTGIVYFTLIKTLEHVALELGRRWGSDRVEIYHGKLDPVEKKRVYERFTASRPEEQLMLLATNAFGMGVDKPDIRYIVHYQVPGSVESYYQEVGRGGRDGEDSRCVLLYEESDLAIQQEFVRWMNPTIDLLRDAAHAFADTDHAELSTDDVRELITGRDRGDRRAEYCVIALEKMGVIEPTPTPEHFRFVRRLEEDEIDNDDLEAKRERDLLRLLDMVQLVQCEDIRQYVLDYFELD